MANSTSVEVSTLYIYPIKSCSPVKINTMLFSQTGPLYDRKFLIIDQTGSFLTQRQFPKLANVIQTIENNNLHISANNKTPITIPLNNTVSKQNITLAKIWDDTVEAVSISAEANEWFSSYLGKNVQLVRQSGTRMSKKKDTLSFVDSYPVHLCSEDSLAELNHRLDIPVEMERFRPNIVIRGNLPFQEDEWNTINIGSSQFKVAKACPRCVIITIDRKTEKSGVEPLKTLASYRKKDSKVLFGQYLSLITANEIHVGDKLIVKC